MDLGNIRAGMDVVGSDGERLGTVDHVEHNRTKLRRNDLASGGQHHWLEQGMIASADGDTARFAMPAGQARHAWQGGSPSQQGA